jgi:hypothetical protein
MDINSDNNDNNDNNVNIMNNNYMIVNNEELKMIKASSTWTGALD